MKTKTFKFYEEDLAALEEARKKLGLRTESEVIRFGIRRALIVAKNEGV